MTVENSGSSAYFVSEVIGEEGVTDLNTDNSTWNLTEGNRYQLTITGAISYSFEIRNQSGDPLLSQTNERCFESNSEVNFQTDGQQFNFTFTPELAEELKDYICTVHASMNGSISTQ